MRSSVIPKEPETCNVDPDPRDPRPFFALLRKDGPGVGDKARAHGSARESRGPRGGEKSDKERL